MPPGHTELMKITTDPSADSVCSTGQTTIPDTYVQQLESAIILLLSMTLVGQLGTALH